MLKETTATKQEEDKPLMEARELRVNTCKRRKTCTRIREVKIRETSPWIGLVLKKKKRKENSKGTTTE